MVHLVRMDHFFIEIGKEVKINLLLRLKYAERKGHVHRNTYHGSTNIIVKAKLIAAAA